jgi:hypothetical protein
MPARVRAVEPRRTSALPLRRPFPFVLSALLLVAAFAGSARAQDAAAPDTAAMTPVLAAGDTVVAPAPAPVRDVVARDAPNDRGGEIVVSWSASVDEQAHPERIHAYLLERAQGPDGPWTRVDSLGLGTLSKNDGVTRGETWHYRVTALGPGGASAPAAAAAPATATAQWFNLQRLSVFLAIVSFLAAMMWFISRAQSGQQLFVRRIPGIDAIEEAIGRATEMGRSVLYVPGINDIDDIQTMASLNILESVAKMTAKYETPIIVPTNYPVVMTLAQEMVKNGYVAAGRADGYDPNSVRYVTTEQFAYVAAITGIMLRDKPAANIYLGSFYAESLLLAETGFSTKAIQIAGTAQVAQLPFFVVACDYTLIGEELYAAGAYLSREPRLLGSLKASDLLKVAIIFIIVVGSVLETMHITSFTRFMSSQ